LRPYSPGGPLSALAPARGGSIPRTPSGHRLQLGLPGYLILFAPQAFVYERQVLARKPSSPQVFFPISTHFTGPPGVLLPSLALKLPRIDGPLPVKPGDFTTDAKSRLHTLYAQ